MSPKILQRHASLEPFPDTLLKAAKIVSLKRGEFLFHRGGSVDSVFFVLEGEIRGVSRKPWKNPVTSPVTSRSV